MLAVTQILCCRGRTLRTRPRTGVFKPLCRGAQSVSEQPQLCELSGPIFGFTTQNFSMVGGYTENLKKKTQHCKIGGWVLAWVWALALDSTVCLSEKRYS